MESLKLNDTIHRAFAGLKRALEQRFETMNLTDRQILILLALEEQEDLSITPQVLCERLIGCAIADAPRSELEGVARDIQGIQRLGLAFRKQDRNGMKSLVISLPGRAELRRQRRTARLRDPSPVAPRRKSAAGVLLAAAPCVLLAACGSVTTSTGTEPSATGRGTQARVARSRPSLVQTRSSEGEPQWVYCLDNCPPITPKRPFAGHPAASQPVADGESAAPRQLPNQYFVYFALGSSIPRSGSDRVIEALVPKAKRAAQIELTGTTDASGSPALNRRLALQRADAVKRALVSKGVPSERIRINVKLNAEAIPSEPAWPGAAPRDVMTSARRVEITFKGDSGSSVPGAPGTSATVQSRI